MTPESPQKKRFISLRVKLLVGFTLLFMVVFAVAFYWFYTFATDVAMNQIEEDMLTTLHGGLKGIDGDTFAALAEEGENTKVMSNLGMLAMREGKKDEAAGFFRSILEFDPKDRPESF